MLGVLGWWLLLSCASDGDCGSGPIDVTLGSGVSAFAALATGDDVTMVFGPQGGWHIDVAARIAGVGPDVEVLPRVVRASDGLALAGDQLPTLLLLADHDPSACTGDAIGVRAFLDDAEPTVPYPEFICSLDGERVEVTVEVGDFSGRSGEATLEVTARAAANQSCP